MLPALRPTQRSLTVGSLRVSDNDWNSLVFNPRIWGSRPTDAILRLTYRNIPEDDAALFVSNYHATLSGFLPDTLSPEIVSGITEPRLLARLDCPWRYTEAPRIEAVITGIVNLQISLIADFSPLVTELTAP